MAITTPFPGVHYDGDFSQALPCSEILVSRPFEEFGDTVTRLYKQKYCRARVNFSALAIDSSGPLGGKLVDETEPEALGGGIIEWWRVWADLPKTHDEPSSITYGLQYEVIADGKGSIAEIPQTYASREQHDFFYAPKGTYDIPILYTTRLVELAGSIYLTPNGAKWPLATNSRGEIVAENSTIKRWKGNFYDRSTHFIKLSAISNLPLT